jgi:hypothetical protein
MHMLFHLFVFPFSFLASHFGVYNRDGVSLIRNAATICNFIRWICIQIATLKISCRQTFFFREAFLKSIINVPKLLYYAYMQKLIGILYGPVGPNCMRPIGRGKLVTREWLSLLYRREARIMRFLWSSCSVRTLRLGKWGILSSFEELCFGIIGI